MKSLEVLKKACYAIESEYGEGSADVYFDALEQIKADLEILEMLRKHLKYQELHFMEDTPRIQQWLEENENE